MQYSILVPARYRRATGFSRLNLSVREASHQVFRYVRHPRGGAVSIPPSAMCELRHGTRSSVYLIDVVGFPRLAEAVLLYGKVHFTGIRAERYRMLYQAYECLEPHPSLDFAAVRHGLSHAVAALSRPRTVATLKRLFGTVSIDLERSSHVKVFYVQLVRLLVEVDRLLAEAIVRTRDSLLVVPRRRDVLYDRETRTLLKRRHLPSAVRRTRPNKQQSLPLLFP
jgi:hypothetical protein